MFTIAGPIVWTACCLTALVCSVLARRSQRARRLGRLAVGVLMLIGGALFNAVQLVQGNDYADFANPSPIPWITQTWRSVVPPNHVALIGLLVAFEAIAGVLLLRGGPSTQLGYTAVIAFHSLLWLFGWFEAVYCLLMLPTLALLWRAEHRTQAALPSPHGLPPHKDAPRVRTDAGLR